MKIYLTTDAETRGIRCVEAELRYNRYDVSHRCGRWFDENLDAYVEGKTCELTESAARKSVRKRLFAEHDRCLERATELRRKLMDEGFPKVVMG